MSRRTFRAKVFFEKNCTFFTFGHWAKLLYNFYHSFVAGQSKKYFRCRGEGFQRINFFPLEKFRVDYNFWIFSTNFYHLAKNFNTVVKNALTCPALYSEIETNLCGIIIFFSTFRNFSSLFQFWCNISSGMLIKHPKWQRNSLRKKIVF